MSPNLECFNLHYRVLFHTWAGFLYRALSCTWTCLDNSSLHVLLLDLSLYTTETCAALRRVYTLGPELHLDMSTQQIPVLHLDVSTHWGLGFTWDLSILQILCFTWTCFLYRDLSWTWMCPHYRFLCQALDEFCLLCFDPVLFFASIFLISGISQVCFSSIFFRSLIES